MYPVLSKVESSLKKSPRKKVASCDEVLVKYTVQCLNMDNHADAINTIRVRKTYVRPTSAWSSFEKELKKECGCASIRKIKYIDDDNDKIYIVDSQELEAAIFKEGVSKFEILFLKHEIVYTAQFINEKNPDEPNEEIGTRKAYPSHSNSSSNGAWDIFLSTVQQASKNVQIKKIKYTDGNNNELYIVSREELDIAIFTEGRRKFHVMFELEILYTAQRLDEKKPEKPDKNIGVRKAYPLPSLPSNPVRSAWNIFSVTINQVYENSEIKKIMYTDKSGKDIIIVNREELEKAIFCEGIAVFHVLFKF